MQNFASGMCITITCALDITSLYCSSCCGTASVILDVGRPVKVTASTAKLQHILNMANRFHNALLPVFSLVMPVGYAEKAADGDVFFILLILFFMLLVIVIISFILKL